MAPKNFVKIILKWYDQHGRHDLPWQKNPTAYRVWISEIMLQQTQVTTVIDYYRRFMRYFPNLKSLAVAKQDEVLALWSGLGYYARARNLHRSAQILYEKHNSRFPKTVEELSQLPGIGRSTAGAILSLSMKIPAPILDGNVKRVLTRFHAIEGWTGQTDVQNKLWEFATVFTPNSRVNHYNQAMMDLGAMICTRTQPKCALCPLQKECQAYQLNAVNQFPTPKPKKNRPEKSTIMLILQKPNGEILLEKRPPTGIWGSLWSLPECNSYADIKIWCLQNYHCTVIKKESWHPLYHDFSHFRLKISPVLLQVKIKQHIMDSERLFWYNLADQTPGGIAAPIKKILSLLDGVLV